MQHRRAELVRAEARRGRRRTIFTDEALARAVAESEALAKLAPDDPEAMPALGPQTYVPVNALLRLHGESRPRRIARSAALTALAAGAQARAISGRRVHHRTNASAGRARQHEGIVRVSPRDERELQLTVRTTDGTGSGWAGADHPDWTQLDFKAVSERAIDKASSSRNPVAIEPGRYTVILEPQAVGDLVQLIGDYARCALRPTKDAAPFAKQGGGNKIGEKIVDRARHASSPIRRIRSCSRSRSTARDLPLAARCSSRTEC